jgi:hypothetical protein
MAIKDFLQYFLEIRIYFTIETENLIPYGKITMIIGCRNIRSTYVLLDNDKITSNLPNIPLMHMFILSLLY